MKSQAIAWNTQAFNLQPATYNCKEKGILKHQSIGAMLILSVFALLAIVSHASAQEGSPVNIGDEKHGAHILPLPGEALQRQGQPQGQLTFKGGPVMGAGHGVLADGVYTYAIFWLPSILQNGQSTGMSPTYIPVLANMLRNYPGHGIGNNNTQYDSNCTQVVWAGGEDDYHCAFPGWDWYRYIPNAGGATSYLDTTPYPPSGCNDPVTPGNCITDAQVRAEIQNVMSKKGWTGGLNKMFLLFTSQGEGSCLDNGPIHCSYNYYCGHHADINSDGTAIIYGNIPYGEPAYCQVPGTPSPNNDAAADTAANVASYELTGAITDPLPIALPAWQTSTGEEISALCAFNYGTNTWDLQGSTYQANQMWNGSFFELQTEYDNHTGSCVQVGP